MRYGEIKRATAETEIFIALNIDGTGKGNIQSGCGFLDHMLTLFAKHARFDMTLECKGDTFIDYHHTAEDIGICLGKAFAKALGDKKGIIRFGNIILPMDEALILSAVDISGRSFLRYDVKIPTEKIGVFDSELVEEFWSAFIRNAAVTLHIQQLSGSNSHHIAEGIFKSVARSLKEAVRIDDNFKDEIPSTKGVL